MLTQVDELIPGFVKTGMQGLEVYYANTAKNLTSFYEGLAKKYGLLMTGGSDAHGEAKKNTYVGKLKIPYELVENLKAAQKS
jgi:predicted metal-dependent phosphoesterase TrpH